MHTRKLLVPAELESVLRRTQEGLFDAEGWKQEVRERGLFVDLSRIEWIELSAALRVVLIIERALLDRVPVTIALPLERSRSTEEHYSKPSSGLPRDKRTELENRWKRRAAARRFFDRLGFLEALGAPHLAEARELLRVTKDYDSSLESDRKGREEEVGEGPASEIGLEEVEPFIVPLRWLTPASPEATAEVLKHFVAVVNSARGLDSRFDAEALADVVLHELVENAVQHSGAERALVAAFAQPPGLLPEPDHFVQCERGFAKWLRGVDRSSVEVVVGDSGVGLCGKLSAAYEEADQWGGTSSVPHLPEGRDASILAWAFDRRSSSDEAGRRGTRGLYRVDRIVKRHVGLVTIRSGRDLAGWDHGGLSHDALVAQPRAEERLAPVPGTVVRAQMMAMPDEVPHRAAGEPPGDVELELGSIRLSQHGEVLVNGDPAEDVLGTSGEDTCWLLVCEAGLAREEMETLLLGLAAARDPATAAVVVDNLETAKLACEGVNVEIEERKRHREESERKRYEACDPVLVMDTRGNATWTGTTEPIAHFLADLLAAPRAETGMKEATGAGLEAISTLRRDSGLAVLTADGIGLRLHRRAIADGVARHVDRLVHDTIEKSGGGTLMTPALVRVRAWIDVDLLFAHCVDPAIPFLALAQRARESPKFGGSPSLLIAESSVDERRLKALGNALGAKRHETIPGEVGAEGSEGVGIADAGDQVAVYADLISSGESIRRSLSQIARDDARPLAVLCLVDAREKTGEPIDLWGLQVPVISLVANSTVAEPGESKALPVDAQGRVEPPLPSPPEYRVKPEEELMPLAGKTEAVHFGHIGGNANRHFTFYANAQRLLRPPTLRTEMREAVRAWKDGLEGGRRVEVWYPRPEPKVSRPAETIANELADELSGLEKRGVARQRVWGGWKFPLTLRGADLAEGTAVVIVDWGALEGTSLMEMVRLAGEGGATSIFACVCLSQLPAEAEWHLRSVRKVEVTRQKPAPSLLEKPPPPEKKEIPLRVEFLSAIPVRAFGPRECPVCQELNRLADHEMPTPELRRFAKEQREKRLHLTSRAEAAEQPIWRLDRAPLGGDRSVAMLAIRHELEAALRSTRVRHEIAERLKGLTKVLYAADDEDLCDSDNIEDAWRESVDWLRLLALERQWLERPPLVLEGPRESIGQLAAAVAVAAEIDPDDRATSIAVLRASSKPLFVEHAFEIFKRTVEQALPRRQLFYSLLSTTDRPYVRSPQTWKPLVETLERMRSAILEGDVPRRAGLTEVELLLDRAVLRLGVADLSGIPEPTVWRRLGESVDFAGTKHELGARIRRLEAMARREIFPSSAADDRTDPVITTTLDDWEKVENFLRNTVLPHLRCLRRVFDSDVAKEIFGPDLPWLTELLDSRSGVGEWPISVIVAEVDEGKASFHEPRIWTRFSAEFQRIAATLLRQRLTSGDPDFAGGEPSRLIRFLEGIPADLGRDVRHAVETRTEDCFSSIEIAPIPDSLDVFFPSLSLRELLGEVLENVCKHRVTDSAAEPRKPSVKIRLHEEDGLARLAILNTGTTPTRPAGDLLAKYTETLECFGGELTPKVTGGSESPFTFRAEITLRRFGGR